MEPFLQRNQIQDKLREITQSTQNADAVKSAMQVWMQKHGCEEFEMRQIMNDLTSYKEYLSLLN